MTQTQMYQQMQLKDRHIFKYGKQKKILDIQNKDWLIFSN